MMPGVITYFPGGSDSSVGGNVSEFWDGDADVYIRYDESGAVLEERPLTTTEKAQINGSL